LKATLLLNMLKNAKIIPLRLLLDANFYTIFEGHILDNNMFTLLLLSLFKCLLLLTLFSNNSLPLISSIIAYIVVTIVAATTVAVTSNKTTNCNILLQNLCFNTYYCFSTVNKKLKVSFDVNSTCCFFTSLVVTRNKIQINVTANLALNLKASIYFAVIIIMFLH
jgi:hypothetical protein